MLSSPSSAIRWPRRGDLLFHQEEGRIARVGVFYPHKGRIGDGGVADPGFCSIDYSVALKTGGGAEIEVSQPASGSGLGEAADKSPLSSLGPICCGPSEAEEQK